MSPNYLSKIFLLLILRDVKNSKNKKNKNIKVLKSMTKRKPILLYNVLVNWIGYINVTQIAHAINIVIIMMFNKIEVCYLHLFITMVTNEEYVTYYTSYVFYYLRLENYQELLTLREHLSSFTVLWWCPRCSSF